jgi:leucyl aminopeptidase (aminopeptidase T)
MDSRERELGKAALIFVDELLNLKQGERFLIYIDESSCHHTASAIQECAHQIGVRTDLFQLNSNLDLLERSRALMDRVEDGNFNVICELSGQYFYQTPAWQRAVESGARIYSLCGMDADAFIRCVGTVNHDLMFQFGIALREILKDANSIQIVTQGGSNIKVPMYNKIVTRLIAKLTRKQISYSLVGHPSGKLSLKNKSTFVGGQLAFQGIPEAIEGTAVIDGYLWPPNEIGHIDNPIILKIKKGKVIEINGCPRKSKILRQWLDKKTKEIQHFCIGYNPGAKLSGKLMEAERVFGVVSIGIGTYPFHTDGIIKNPSILVNDKILVRDGLFIHKELSILQKKLNTNTQGKA